MQHAHEWSLARAAKDRIREVVRFIMDPEADKQEPGASNISAPGQYIESYKEPGISR